MKSIILVDDDASILEIFKLVFERAGYSVTAYDRGDDILNNRFDKPDIFILDRHLSGSDGLDICRFLKRREQYKNTPVIIFSASPCIATQAKEAGADDFIEKPFKTKDLLNLIEKFVS